MSQPAPIIFGEVLFDRFPDGTAVLGGAPFNVAWHLQAFGLAPRMVTRVGTDAPGAEVLAAMERWGMDTTGVQHDPHHPTGAVTVTVEEGEPSYEIAPGQAWDHLDGSALPAHPGGGILYHGTLALRSAPSQGALVALRRAGGGEALVDVNLRTPWYDPEAVKSLVRAARWIKLNEDELATLTPAEGDPDHRARGLLAAAALECLVVTRGAAGSVVYGNDGMRHASRPDPVAAVVDTVGAGDAFSSVVILGLTRGWSWPDILDRAAGFAAAVVGVRGATTQEPGFYEPFIATWGVG